MGPLSGGFVRTLEAQAAPATAASGQQLQQDVAAAGGAPVMAASWAWGPQPAACSSGPTPPAITSEQHLHLLSTMQLCSQLSCLFSAIAQKFVVQHNLCICQASRGSAVFARGASSGVVSRELHGAAPPARRISAPRLTHPAEGHHRHTQVLSHSCVPLPAQAWLAASSDADINGTGDFALFSPEPALVGDPLFAALRLHR